MKATNTRKTPKYKVLLRLRETVFGQKKIIQFKKKKWGQLKKRVHNFIRRTKVKTQNHRISRLTRYAKRLKNTFRTELYNKQRINLFYGNLKENYFKKVVRKASSQSRILKKSIFRNKEDLFISYFESRIDSILFREGFFLSLREIRQVLSNGHVFVNKKHILNGNFILKEGDIISFSPALIAKVIKVNLKTWRKKRFIKLYPSYLEFNLKIFTIALVEPVTITKLRQFFPFWLNLKTMFHRYS